MLKEDIKMLRQILDNLVLFSLKEEELMEKVRNKNASDYSFSGNLRTQQQLRDAFGHVDDSLFALSLRRPEIFEEINKEIGDVYYNIDKALTLFADIKIYEGVSNQQFALTASNNLASFLADNLGNMQMQMSPSSGSGSGSSGQQLQDIIQSQEQLGEQMGKKPGKKPGEGEQGSEGEEQGGEGSKKGESGKSGENGKDGNQKGKGDGKDGSGEGNGDSNGQGGNGDSEENMQMIFEIYKEQQRLRNALEQQLENMEGKGTKALARNIIREMENVEDQLLREGFNTSVRRRMENLKHQLLKLKDASIEQGLDNARKSNANNQKFKGKSLEQNPFLKEYLEQIELLGRHVLPLQTIYKAKVNTYFKKSD